MLYFRWFIFLGLSIISLIGINPTIDYYSNYFGKVTNNLNDNINLNYEFSINHDLNEIQYNSLSTVILMMHHRLAHYH